MIKKNIFKWLFFNPLGWLVSLGLLVLMAVSISSAWEAFTCSDITTETNRPTKYSIVSSCYVQVNNEWIPASRWRAVE